MASLDALRRRWPKSLPLQPLPSESWAKQEPTWKGANPQVIESALKRAKTRPTGNWFVFAASRDIGHDTPFGRDIGGLELVAWRGEDGGIHIAPGSCPHLGAPLDKAKIECDTLICLWHGMPLGPTGRPGWRPLPAFDDGILVWVRLDDLGGEEPTEVPIVPLRPPAATSIDAVITLTGICETDDVVANRLDPWHGAWFHPYSFARLKVVDAPTDIDVPEEDDRFLVDVTFRVSRGAGVPVRAEFVCPGPRTIIMRILEGEGAGSVVETHATPLGLGPDGKPRTAVIEATVASSDRKGFKIARRVAPLLRPPMGWTAARLWKDDLDYAERRYHLRSKGL
ncbi:DUF5914 domain-containing protein [Rhodococcoides yunnanense]|uniref:DUF5914 domain-containing protein n=1 Tax=Rhodococcoides yunnanense TaxID=278209 RepID=UPI000932E8B2|nr:DUF5914 domain-containing protein [Rhodococcus yunnanensis]